MVQVVIQPSFGNADAQRHWADTIAQEVSLTDADLRSTFSPDQIVALESLHPAGKARFWGAVSSHDTRMDGLATGDIVLFTGKKHVRGIGEVGVSFRNSRTADVLWTPHEDRGSYHNVSSTSYETPARTTLVRRSESLLVANYTAHLGIEHERTSTPVGLTDLYMPTESGGHALIEAKSSVSRRHVREAVGQLLDYAPHCPDVTEMAILLPECPDHQTIDYVHRYGIDVIYRTPTGSFDKAPAPAETRTAILGLATTQQRTTPPLQQALGRSLRGDWQPSATRATAHTAPATARTVRPGAPTSRGVER